MIRGLRDFHVLDLSSRIAGAYATKLFADAGADVVKVGALAADASALARFLAAGKHIAPCGDALVSGADLIVVDETSSPPAATAQQVVLSITPWGRAGPFCERASSELTLQAESGSIGTRGLPGQEPFQAGGRITEWVGGTYAAVAALAALSRMRRTGHGERVDFSLFEAITLAGTNFLDLAYRLMAGPPDPEKLGPLPQSVETPSIEPTQDGYVGFCTNSRQQVSDFMLLIGRPELRDDEQLAQVAGRMARFAEWNQIVHAYTREHTTAEVLEAAAALRIPVAPVLSGETVRQHEQIVARGVLRRSPDGVLVPRRPYRVNFEDPPEPRGVEAPSAAHTFPSRGAPAAGERAAPAARGDPHPRPHGLVGGPLRHRDARGARRRRDPRRVGGAARRHADGRRHGAPPLPRVLGGQRVLPRCERQQARAHARPRPARGRRAREALDRALRRRDRELHAARARGLGSRAGMRSRRRTRARSWCACRPSGCRARGATTPASRRRWSSSAASPGSRAIRATSRASSAGRAIRSRACTRRGRSSSRSRSARRTGRGVHVECTMVEAALNAAAEAIVEFGATGRVLGRMGNRSRDAALQGLYPCAGSAPGREQWVALSARAKAPLPEAELAQWIAARDRDDVVRWLQEQGIPAAPVADPRIASLHPQHAARGFFEEIEHPVVGRQPIPTVPFRYASVSRWLRSPAPTLGEHNREILGGLLGLQDAELAELEASGIIGTRPRV